MKYFIDRIEPEYLFEVDFEKQRYKVTSLGFRWMVSGWLYPTKGYVPSCFPEEIKFFSNTEVYKEISNTQFKALVSLHTSR